MARTPRLTRRELALAATIAGAHALVPPAFGRIIEPRGQEGPGRFLDGVASGEPSHDAVTFWSRLSTDRPVSGARLVVAEDEGLTRTVATAVVPTSRSVDGALKTRIDGLQPGRHYWYVWQSADDTSPVGRTKTAPHPSSNDPVNVGFSSCQNYPVGFFNAHADAAQDDLDLYAFLGDYTYEYDSTADPDIAGRGDVASVDLRTYRSKLRLYRQDPDLRELHRLHPVVHIWDDHEVADNYSDNDPRPSDLQRAAGYRASFEWLPRMAMPQERYRIYKPIRLGRQAELFLLDQRQYRDDQPCNDEFFVPCAESEQPGRTFLGAEQKRWFTEALAGSRASWKLVANAAMIMSLDAIPGQGLNPDQWDGYGAERREILEHVRARGVQDVTFITGDIHTFFAGAVTTTGDATGRPAATEFVGGSITSLGFEKLPPTFWTRSMRVKPRALRAMGEVEGTMSGGVRSRRWFRCRRGPDRRSRSTAARSDDDPIPSTIPRRSPGAW